MSQAPPVIPPSGFQSTFSHALRAYKKRTREDLILHPLAARLQSCVSPDAILAVLQEQARAIDQSWDADEKLAMWLDPIVNVLYTLSSSLGEGVGLVPSPAKVIFVGIGVILSEAHATRANRVVLVDIFSRMGKFFRRLVTYTMVPPPLSTKNSNEEIMLTVLSIITSVTEEVTEGRARKYLKRLMGRNSVEDALQKLDGLTQEEAQTATAAGDSVNGGRITPHNDQEPRVAPCNVEEDPTSPHTFSASANGGSNTVPRHQLVLERWLSPPDPSMNHNMECQARHKGTAEWLFQNNTFKQWKSTGSLLWIHGKPGSGKSVLCSAIIEDISTMCKAGSASMAYFYCDFKDNYKQSRLDMIPSLLTQLSARSDRCRDILSRLYSAYSNRGGQMPTGSVLTECLKEMLSIPGQSPVYIIIDAIDECPDIPGVPSPREDTLELLKELLELHLPNLRLCVTSRPEIGIRAVLEPLLSHRISLHDEIGQKKDIVDYVSAVMGDREFERWRDEDKLLVIKTLSERAGGMFRWASCQLDILRHCLPPGVRHVLDELPKSLDETYERILMEISMANRKHARRLLQCLTAASRPLRVDELASVLAVDFDSEEMIPTLHVDWRWEDQERAVLSTCSSLVEVITIDDSRVVQFSHHSVKEFLISDRLATSSERVLFYHISFPPAHTILARACLSVLLRLDDHIDTDNVKSYPLAEYAARHWLDHAQFRDVESDIQDGVKALFDSGKPHFSTWVRLNDIDESPGSPSPRTHSTQPQAGALYYSVLCGFPWLVEHLIVDQGMDVNARGGHYITPLHAALYKGHVAIARLLIEYGANVNVQDDEDSSPLRMALYFGYFDVVYPMLRKGADANVQPNKRPGSMPLLHIASCSGHSNAVQSLLEYGARVNARDGKGRTPLHVASDSGDFDAVQLLLEYQADVTSRDNKDSTPLHLVSIKGNLEIVRLLIQHGADVNVRDNNMSTPLHLALANGNEKVAGFLINHEANVNAQDNKKSTPLHIASLNGNLDLVDMLLKRGADVNARDNRRRTPLHLASDTGSTKLVELLIKHGADVDAEDNTHSTPLHIASRRGPSDVVKYLLEHGAMPDVQNNKGRTPLHIATQESAVEAVRCLLTRGADPNVSDGDRRVPLHEATKNNNKKLQWLLIEHGASTYAQDNDNKIPSQLRPDGGVKH